MMAPKSKEKQVQEHLELVLGVFFGSRVSSRTN